MRAVSARMADARSGAGTVRPSALLMILDVTTTMSPSANGPPGSAWIAVSTTSARSVSGATSPIPSGAKIVIMPCRT